MTVGNVTSVQCLSTHLTSFAVLVDVAGGLQVCIGCHSIRMLLWLICIYTSKVQSLPYFVIMCYFLCRAYQKWSVRPCRLFHTLDVPSQQSASLLLLCSSYFKGMIKKRSLTTLSIFWTNMYHFVHLPNSAFFALRVMHLFAGRSYLMLFTCFSIWICVCLCCWDISHSWLELRLPLAAL